MPHFVIEYSRSLEEGHDIDQIMRIVHEAGEKSQIMQVEDIKVRARPYDHYRLLEAGDSFAHVTIYLLEGRTDEQKRHLSMLVREGLQDYLADVTSISIDVRDMNPHAYKKRLLPSAMPE